MSETVSAPADAGAAPTPTASAMEDMVKALGIEDTAPDISQTSDAESTGDSGEEMITLKVNGKNIERTRSEVVKAAQLYEATEVKLEAAKKQLEEAKGLQAKVGEQQQLIRNIIGVLQRGDLDTIGEFASEYLNAGDVFNKAVVNYALKLYELSRMSPEQREAFENKRLLTKMRNEAEQRAKQDQERAYEYQVNQWSQHIAVEIPKAIAEVGLVDSPFIREHIVSAWRNAIERGQNPTATAVAQFVKERLDAAKISFGGTQAPQVPQRRHATAQSVKRASGTAAPEPDSYVSFSDWQKSRGR